MSGESSLGARAYRDLVGHFATGVTVITMAGEAPRGMTANAITSVSLDPQLLLVCVDKGSTTHDPLLHSGAFTVNILAADQREASDFFALHGEEHERSLRTGDMPDRMGGFSYHPGATGSPILEGTLGWLDCRIWDNYDGGDHTIVVGEVVDMELSRRNGGPLLFFTGGYRRIGGPV